MSISDSLPTSAAFGILPHFQHPCAAPLGKKSSSIVRTAPDAGTLRACEVHFALNVMPPPTAIPQNEAETFLKRASRLIRLAVSSLSEGLPKRTRERDYDDLKREVFKDVARKRDPRRIVTTRRLTAEQVEKVLENRRVYNYDAQKQS